ncbi:hypothetical protein ABZ897_00955 [Nonomuraea sp. NPDC046802]|uniref:hypothetical protein n=1 Tax=Nonomuraea sp. NPDC046802 TaxID=3154919 RepID=UPI0033C90919
MTPEMWIALIALAGTVAGGAVTYRTSRATTAVEQNKVDAAAYDRAKAIYESALQLLEEQLERVRVQLTTVTTQLAQEQDTSNAMRMQIRGLTNQIADLERTVADLRLQLSRAGIPVEES